MAVQGREPASDSSNFITLAFQSQPAQRPYTAFVSGATDENLSALRVIQAQGYNWVTLPTTATICKRVLYARGVNIYSLRAGTNQWPVMRRLTTGSKPKLTGATFVVAGQEGRVQVIHLPGIYESNVR